jgi:hypothetical protein
MQAILRVPNRFTTYVVHVLTEFPKLKARGSHEGGQCRERKTLTPQPQLRALRDDESRRDDHDGPEPIAQPRSTRLKQAASL